MNVRRAELKIIIDRSRSAGTVSGTYLLIWGAFATVCGALGVTNAWGLVDMLIQTEAQDRLGTGRAGATRLSKTLVRRIGAVLLAVGCVSLVIGIWKL
jgi:di/tricarboxylate transporter